MNVDIMKVALVSAFLEDDVYEHILDEKFMEEVICKEDHFYHRIARSLLNINIEPIVFMMSQKKDVRKFTHKYGHTIMRIPALRIPFIHEPIVYSSHLINYVKEDFEICHFVSGYYVMYKIPDMFDYAVMKLHGKIPIVSRWAGGNYNWLWPLRKTFKKMALQRCDKITCSSKEEISLLENKFEIPRNKISHLVNPLDLSTFQMRDKKNAAEKIGINPDFKYLLYIGRLVKNKGLENLLEVFVKIKNDNQNLKLIIIGDGQLYQYIENFVKYHSLEKDVIIKGRLSHDELCYFYNVSSALINIGMSGGLGNVIVESLASGVPVIASNVGATQEFVNEKSKNGILIDPGNKIQLKEAIQKIIDNENLFRNRNQSFVMEFSYENFGKKISKIYEEITK